MIHATYMLSNRETSDLTEKDMCNVNQPETAEEFTIWGTEEL
jgi:hypothetical protein